MAWCYEIRGSVNRLVELRSGFATEKEARKAGERAKRVIDCICYPNFETLTLITKKEDGSALDHLAEMSAPTEKWLGPLAKRDVNVNLKYAWQEAVLDAFWETHPENLPGKINMAERGLSTRLLDPAPFDTDERIAIGEALLALRRLFRELADSRQEPTDKEDIA